MPDDMDVQDRMYACFGSYEDRDCATCIAHHEHNGPCCYGRQDKFDPDDDTKNGCQECLHFDNCAEDCGYELVEEEEEETKPPPLFSSYTTPFQQQQKKPAPRITIRGGASVRQPVRTTYTSPVSTSPVSTALASRSMTVGQLAKVGQQYGRASNPERFFKDSIWGSFSGFLRAALHFVDTHYWD